ncbi:MAG: SDR family oxidoreductase [Candidatus Bathyarchaeia archaeon]
MPKHFSQILVTGGAGFIGSHLVDKLLNEGYAVTVVDNFYSGNPKNIVHHQNKEDFHLIKGDIRDYDLIKNAIKGMDAVFHEAAIVSVPLSVKDPILTIDVNVKGTLNVLKAASKFGVKRFIYASSAAVYGDLKPHKKSEDAALNPTSPYGVSKLQAENYVKSFHGLYGLETISLRYFNAYGPRQQVNVQNNYSGVITIFVDRISKNMPPIIFGDGEQTRDFVYIDDIVEANMLALNVSEASGEIFNIGTGTPISINQLAEVLKRTIKKENLKNIYADPRPGDILHSYADIRKAKEILKFQPKVPLEEGLFRLIEWYRKELISI